MCRTQLVNYSFAPLVESYEKCHNSPSVVFLNQFGITMGNVSVMVPFCAMGILILFAWFKRLMNIRDEGPNYSTIEVEHASRSLAIALLLKRDNMCQIDEIIHNDPEIVNHPKILPILDQLVSELTAVAQISKKSESNVGTVNGSLELQNVTSSLHDNHGK